MTGTIVGERYEILRTLGQGAFGHTFLAHDRVDDRAVAVKLLDTRGRHDPKVHELFRREADVLRSVRHHGIPEIHDTLQDTWLGAPASFLVMEFIEGESLEHIIEAKRSLDGATVVHLFLELLGILDYLHGRVPPILHRDIKPSNIVVRPNGFPALVDFGSVRRVFLTPEESGSTVAGTFGYMPYEQYMGQATPASDLYSTAATFLHLLTGRPPRDFMNDEGRISVPASLPAEPRLRAVIERLLRPSPAERYASARDVRNALVGASVPAVRTQGAVAAAGAGGGGGLQSETDVRTTERVASLPPAPRPLEGETRRLMKASSPGALRLMYASEKGGDWGWSDLASVIFFSVLTAGIMPVIFWNIASTKRRRMRRFFRDGVPAVAEVTKMEPQEMAFDEKLVRVSFQFTVDGRLYRDSDTVLPVVSDRWQPGDHIPILYLPERDCDAVIVAVE
ncbi:MAG TPA: serine/threonine-protein kinase [Gemmatimonadaceae bacterium]|nr:serine/threonine-protein kinase [Gemmatimonadaceae bacterium]